jgi:hypothetical protein
MRWSKGLPRNAACWPALSLTPSGHAGQAGGARRRQAGSPSAGRRGSLVRFRGPAGSQVAAAAGRAGKHLSVFSCGLAEH